MRVVFVYYDTSNEVGGVSSWLYRLLPRLKNKDVDVIVHVLSDTGREEVVCATLRSLAIPFKMAPGFRNTHKDVRQCLRWLEQDQPDVYVPNSVLPAYFAARWAKEQGIASVAVLHSDEKFYHAIIDWFLGRGLITDAVAVSEGLRSRAAAALGGKGEVVSLGYGVNLPEGRATWSEPFRLVYLGRLTEEQKRISEVTRAFIRATETIPGTEAWIVGEGRDRDKVVDQLAAARQPCLVKLLPGVPNAEIYDVLIQCHSLVLLSDYEGLPVSMLEAMAAGVVPICYEGEGGIKEALEHGVSGLMVGDRENAFLSAVRQLRDDEQRWRRLSQQAQRVVAERYSVDANVGGWMTLLQRVSAAQEKSEPFKAPTWFSLPPPDVRFGFSDTRNLHGGLVRRAWNKMNKLFGKTA